MEANIFKVEPPESPPIDKKNNIKKTKNVVLKTISAFLLVFAVLFSGFFATKTNSLNSNDFSEVYAAEVGKTYWMLDETTGTLHLSGVQSTGYELIDESALAIASSVPWYSKRASIITVAFDSEVAPKNIRNWFNGCSNLAEIKNIERLSTGNVTDMSYTFRDCSKLTSLNTSNFDTSNAVFMNYMFSECSSLTNLDVSGFDTKNVTDMSYMFNGCKALTNLDVSGFNTSKVMRMDNMFQNCSSLTSLDISGFGTNNVTDMSYMFNGCKALTNLDVSGFNTSKVTRMNYMFQNCSSLTSLDLSNFDTRNVTNMLSMFLNCSKLTSLDLNSFDTGKVKNMNYMFQNCSNLTNLNVSSFNTSNATGMLRMFAGCSSLTNLDVSGFNTSKATTMAGMFDNCLKLTSLDVSGFDTRNVMNMSDMFKSCQKLTTLDVSGFNTSKVTRMDNMFRNCPDLTSLDVSSFDTSKVTNMDSMFAVCSSLTALDVSTFNTSEVTNMSSMFYNCQNLTNLDLSNFDTGKVTNMKSMFYKCSPSIFSLSGSLILNSDPSFPSSDYKHIRSADGTRLDGSEVLDLSTVMNDGFTAEEAAQYAGTWAKAGAAEIHDFGDGNYEYVTIDDLWVKNGNVWTYTFKVFDDTMQYYAWEEYLNDYISINMANPDGTVSSPLVIDKALKSGTITNTSDNVGNLSVSKTVEGAPASQADAKFTFNITLTGDKISGTQVFSDIVFKDGEAQIVLKDGESKVIENLPTGTTYTVTETQSSLYTTTYTGDTGAIEKGQTAKAEFVNTYKPPRPGLPGSLTIVKKVEGNYETLPNQKYKFIVNLEGLDSNANYIYSQGTFKSDADGKAIISIELEANEECVFLNLPEGTQYQVTEEAGKYKSSYTIQ